MYLLCGINSCWQRCLVWTTWINISVNSIVLMQACMYVWSIGKWSGLMCTSCGILTFMLLTLLLACVSFPRMSWFLRVLGHRLQVSGLLLPLACDVLMSQLPLHSQKNIRNEVLLMMEPVGSDHFHASFLSVMLWIMCYLFWKPEPIDSNHLRSINLLLTFSALCNLSRLFLCLSKFLSKFLFVSNGN